MTYDSGLLKSRVLIVGGSSRSGTTIVGKLIASLSGVEYFFEPITLYKLIERIDSIKPAVWKDLFETCLYEDLLLNALAGRNLNFNQHDDSYVGLVKEAKEIERRMLVSHRRHELMGRAADVLPAFKITNMIVNLPKVREICPDVQIVAVVRNPLATINSLLEKGWFSDDALDASSPSPLLVCSTIDGVKVPEFLNMETRQLWVKVSEEDRCALYYKRISEGMLAAQSEFTFLSYDKLINDAGAVFDKFLSDLDSCGMTFCRGVRTDLILDKVIKAKRKDNVRLKGVDCGLMSEICDLHAVLESLC